MVYMAKDSDFENDYNYWIYKGQETEVEIPEYINGELVTTTVSMFSPDSGATPVTKVVLRHNHVTDIGCMFFDFDGSAPSIDLSEFNTSNVTDMIQMFFGSFKLESLDLSSFDTSNVTNMADMFYECEKLQKIYARTKEDAEKLKAQATKDGISPKFYIREPVEFDFDIRLGSYNIESIYLKDNNGKLLELKAYRTKLVE